MRTLITDKTIVWSHGKYYCMSHFLLTNKLQAEFSKYIYILDVRETDRTDEWMYESMNVGHDMRNHINYLLLTITKLNEYKSELWEQQIDKWQKQVCLMTDWWGKLAFD